MSRYSLFLGTTTTHVSKDLILREKYPFAKPLANFLISLVPRIYLIIQNSKYILMIVDTNDNLTDKKKIQNRHNLLCFSSKKRKISVADILSEIFIVADDVEKL